MGRARKTTPVKEPRTTRRAGRRTNGVGSVEDWVRYEDRFSKVFRSSPVAIILRTLEDGRVIDVNDRYEELMGFGRDELVGHTVYELELWADPDEGQRVVAQLRCHGSLRNVEGRFRHRSGAIRNVLISAELTDIDGEAVVIGMIIDITERKRMEDELRRSHEQLRSLGARLQQIREEERMRIARELHDEIGGFLTVLKLDLAALKDESRRASPAFAESVESMSSRIVSAIGAVRRICSDLRPSVLDHVGLTAAVSEQVEQWRSKTGIRCVLSARLDDRDVDADRATAAFRIFQEALTNVARHARASAVRVDLWTEDGRLRLAIRDDGSGIAPSALADPTSLGLLGMKERAFPHGGTVEIASRGDGTGTLVDVTIPLRAAPAASIRRAVPAPPPAD